MIPNHSRTDRPDATDICANLDRGSIRGEAEVRGQTPYAADVVAWDFGESLRNPHIFEHALTQHGGALA